jgi:hypothetical protein
MGGDTTTSNTVGSNDVVGDGEGTSSGVMPIGKIHQRKQNKKQEQISTSRV